MPPTNGWWRTPIRAHLLRWRCAPRCGVRGVRLAPVLAPPRIWTLLGVLCPTRVGLLIVYASFAASLSLAADPTLAFAQGDANAGKAVYERKCIGCHGEKGDGKGPAAELLLPKPRDFTKGLYKIRSTANKTPTD